MGFASVADLHRLTINFGSIVTNGYGEGGSSAEPHFASANPVFCSLYETAGLVAVGCVGDQLFIVDVSRLPDFLA